MQLPPFWMRISLLLLLSSCGGTELITGRSPKSSPGRIIPKSEFKIGEPITLLLTNARFSDNFMDLTIWSVSKEGRRFRSRTMRLSSIDTNLNYFRIPEGLFFLPFPGKYIISFSQAGGPLAETRVKVTENRQ